MDAAGEVARREVFIRKISHVSRYRVARFVERAGMCIKPEELDRQAQ